MKIKCLDDNFCAGCPKLEIDNNQTYLYADEGIGYINNLECVNYGLCKRLVRYLHKHPDIIEKLNSQQKQGL